ncbi:MAG: transcription antitermination factor NusB [Candidatus Azobacteroides sp.]|nr:transcription antitermination factor NusB [Candidatus Azobacteroides sp.]
MINRILIRIKVIQILYSYFLNIKRDIPTVEKELFFSLEKAYELYNMFLLLMINISELQARKLDAAKHKLLPTETDLHPDTRFIDNRFMKQLSENNQLKKFVANEKISWINQEELIKSLLDQIISSDIYKEYMASSESSYQADREFWRKVFKNILCNNEDVIQALEDMSVYWNDDVEIVCTFVLKTIKRFEEGAGEDQSLLPMFRAEDDKDFAKELLRRTILHHEEYNELIQAQAKNWEFERIAFMDLVIMQTALAELTGFPSIPVNVTLNEYIEIAKQYSTEKSSTFINGMLDAIIDILKKENKLLKN